MAFICCRDMKPFWTGPAWRVAIICLLLKSLPSDGQFTTSSSFIPPPGVQSSVNNHARRFNIRAGESFTIICNIQNPTQAFIAELYLDGRSIVITDGLLPNTTYSKTGTNGGVSTQINLQLTFENFQAVHNGRYDCFANTTDGTATSLADSRLYGTGPITVTLLSSQYLILYSDEDISIPTQIRGEFNDIYWYYHPTDPLLGSAGREALIDSTGPVPGTGNLWFTQQIVITQGTTPHKAGYYAPQVQDTIVTGRTIMTGESVLVRAYASPTASLPAVGSQSPGADLTVTCTATGYPEPTISFSTSDISASSSMGERITTTTATPSTVFTTTRIITFSGLLASDCGMVTCTASNADRDGTQTATGTTPIQVIGSPDVSITPSPDQAISIGGSLTLSCEAEDCTTNSFVYMWYRDGVNVENGTSLSISGASSSDFGRYECNATGNGGTGSAVIYISEQMVNNEAATVQIHINPGSKCTDFIDTAERLERLTRIETVVKNATTNCFRCQVFFVPSSAFRCIGSNELVVVFVAEIAFSYSTLSPASPLDLLRSWARESPVLNVGGLLLQVDGSCSVEIASVSATPECDPVSTPSTPISSPTSTDNVTAQSDQLTLIIPVVVSCVVVAVLVGAGAVLLVAVCVVRRKKKETVPLAKPEDNKYAYTDPDSGVEIQQNPAYEMTGPVSENHIYDFIPAEKRLAVNEEYM